MPEKMEKLEKELKKQAKKKFPNDEKSQNAYVWGVIRRVFPKWKPSTQKDKG